MDTSEGKCFSKASRSGALTEVCPATMAPTFVAASVFSLANQSSRALNRTRLTRAILCDHSVDELGFDGVYDKVANPGYEVTILQDSDAWMV